MYTKRLCFLLIVLLVTSASWTHARDIVVVVGEDEVVDLTDYLRTYIEPNKSGKILGSNKNGFGAQGMSLEEVRKQAFQPAGDDTSYGFDTNARWLRFTLKNSQPVKKTFYIEENYPLIDYLDAYLVSASEEGEEIVHYATGDLRQYSMRPLGLRHFVFPVTINAYAQKVVYLRYQTSGSLNIKLRVLTEKTLFKHVADEQLVYGLYYGGFLVLILYNFFIFLVVREKLFVLYTLFAMSLAAYMTVQNGFLFQYIFPNYPAVVNKLLLIFLCSSFFFSIRFSRNILNSEQEMPVLNRAGIGFEWLMIGFMVALPLLNYHYMMVPLAALTVIMSIFMISMGFRSFYLRHASAHYYIMAWGALLIGVLIFMLKSYGLIEHNVFTNNAIQIGSMVEMMLLSLVLSQRVSAIKLNSSLDPLTNCYNRRYFDERMTALFSRRGITQRPCSLVVLDIDHFKRFNDRHGHVEGDRAIRLVAQTFMYSIRKPDGCCRYGGEEFVLILPGKDNAAAVALAESLRVRVSEIAILPEPLTISAGVATCAGGSFATPDEFFNAADIALYKAKSDGRNRTVNFDGLGDQRRVSPSQSNAEES